MPLQHLDKEGLTSVWGKIDSLFSRKSESGSLLAPPSNSELQKYLNGDASSLTGNEPIIASNLSTIVQYVKDSTIIYSLSAENDSLEVYNGTYSGNYVVYTVINPSLNVGSATGGILYDNESKTFTVPKKSTLNITFSGSAYAWFSPGSDGPLTSSAMYISVPNLINEFVIANFGTVTNEGKTIPFSTMKQMTIPNDNYTFKVNVRAYGKAPNSSYYQTTEMRIDNFKINISSV